MKKKQVREVIKILLINAIDTSVEVETRYPNLGLAYLASMVYKYLPGLGVKFRIADRDIERLVKNFKPDLVGITCVSQNFNYAKNYVDFLNKRKIPVIIGGIHITLSPHTLPKGCLLGCIGEGDYTFVDIVRQFEKRKSLTPVELSKIDGIVYWSKKKLIRTKRRALEDNLDRIPLPSRELLKIGKHSYMFTSRGCPYRCTFCASSRFWDKLRFFSASYVVQEIEVLVKKYEVETISFFDDLFVADKSRLVQIIKLLREKGLLGRVKYTCSCRANLVDKELAGLLKEMGVVSVGMGLESGSEEVLKYLKGGSVSVANNYKAVKLLKESGIAVNGSFVIGSPDETKEQIMDTYNFIKKSGVDLFDVYILTPYPGTPVWDYAVREGIVRDDENFDWSTLNVNAYNLPKEKIGIVSKHLTKEELLMYYFKFRRFRFWHNLLKVIKHPMVEDLPVMFVKMAREFLTKKVVKV